MGLVGLVVGLCVAAGSEGPARADVAVDRIGSVESLPTPFSSHWLWVGDPLLERTSLVDLDGGSFLGQINAGFGFSVAVFSPKRSEIYMPETHYSRGTRGERTDVVTIYDGASLAPVAEVVIPPKRATNPLPNGNAAISDDERFIAVFNMTPTTSISIVDVERRAFVQEIQTPGCSLVYAAGERRFAMLCANGALMTVALDEAGREVAKTRTEPFFDPEADPVTEKAVRRGDVWYFVSFEGFVHPVDVSGEEPKFGEVWSLLDDRARADSWRIGGAQHLALHAASGRLFSLVHQGGQDTHKDPGSELWVYDLDSRQRTGRIELRNPGLTFLGVPLEFGTDWIWPFNGLYELLLDILASDLGIGQVAVTQGDAPLLVTGSNFTGSMAVYDAVTGEFLRRVISGNMTNGALQVPWGGEPRR